MLLGSGWRLHSLLLLGASGSPLAALDDLEGSVRSAVADAAHRPSGEAPAAVRQSGLGLGP